MIALHIPFGSGLVVDGEIVSWDQEVKDSGIVSIGGVEYAAFYSYDGDGFFSLYDSEAERFIQRADTTGVVYRCSFCLHRLEEDETVLCAPCANLLQSL